jgi:glycerol-3-phosphate dehydrogenase
MMTLTGGPIMTHRRVARKITEDIRKRLTPSGSPRDLQYRGARTIFDHNDSCDVVGMAKVSNAEIARCASDEMPANLADLLMRRLGVGWEPDQGVGQAREIAEIAAPLMGWSDAQIKDELAAYQAQLDHARRKPDCS